MASIERKALDQPDETRPVDKGTVEVVKLDAGTVMRTTFEPGWRWSECVKPLVGGDSCQVDHFGYCISGRMHVQMNGGEEMDVCAGRRDTDPPGPRRLGCRRRAVRGCGLPRRGGVREARVGSAARPSHRLESLPLLAPKSDGTALDPRRRGV